MPVPRPRPFALVVGLLLVAHLVLLGFFPISSEDTWWHLKQGELYVSTRSLPSQDPFAFTTAGREWIHYSWAADVFFYLVYRAAGLDGLVLLRLGILLAIALALYRVLRGSGLHPLASVLAVFLASLALRFRLLIRSEILAFLLLLAVMAILLRLRSAPPRTAFLLLPVQVAWINIHGSALFGIMLPALVLAANLLPQAPASPFSPGWGRLSLDRERRARLAVAVAALPFVSLINPEGPRMLLFPFRQNRMVGFQWLTEWMPVWRLPAYYSRWAEILVPFAIIVGAFVAVSVYLLARERRLDPVGWGIVVSMGLYAMLRNRAVPFFTLAALPVLALALARAAAPARSRRAKQGSGWLTRAGAVACVCVLGASVMAQTVTTPRARHGFGVRPNFFPEGAAAFLERNHLDGRLYNEHEFGGYLIWRRWPANQVLIDGRYDGILFDGALLLACAEAHHSREVFDRITAAYGIDIALTSARPGRQMASLANHPGWARVYADRVAEVYVRRAGRYGSLATAGQERGSAERGPAE